MTLYEHLKNGTKEDMVQELAIVTKWARDLSSTDWNYMQVGTLTLEKLISEALDSEYHGE